MSESNEPNNKPVAPAANAGEPMRGVLTKLMERAPQFSEPNKELGARIRDLGITTQDETQFGQTSVQRAIASAAQDFERATGKQLDLSPIQRAEIAKLMASPTAPAASVGGGAEMPASASAPPADPIREVLAKLVVSLDRLPDSAKALGTKIRELENDARDPVRFNKKSVQHEIAYAAQDFEKAAGKQLNFSPAERLEVAKLAASAPGLENERLLALLRGTARLDDNGLVREIRRYSAEIGQKSNQNTPSIQSRIDTYENRVRQAPRAPEPSPASNEADGAPAAARSDANPSGNKAAAGARSDQRAQTDFTPRGPGKGGAGEQVPPVQTAVLRGGVLDTLAAALRGNGQPKNAPWDPQASPLGDRLRAFQEKVEVREQDRTIGRIERSARTALEALDGFRTSEGATVMNRIQAAARAEPGGMATVLSEMREGGRFGDLRRAFNTALLDDKGFAQAYDRAASALARYGQGREQIEQIVAKRPDAANLAAKFEQLDGQIGERANNIPSRSDGKNMLDDISKTVAEIIQKATESVRAMFSRTPAAGASPAPAA